MVVGSTFLTEVHEPHKDVVVQLYTSAGNCKACKEAAPVFEELAWKLRKNPNIVFAKVDLAENEVPLTVL